MDPAINLLSTMKNLVPSALQKIGSLAKFIHDNKGIVRKTTESLKPLLQTTQDVSEMAGDVRRGVEDLKSVLEAAKTNLTGDEVMVTSTGASAIVDKLADNLEVIPDPEIILDDEGPLDDLRGGFIPLKRFNDDIEEIAAKSRHHPLHLATIPTKYFETPGGIYGISSAGEAAPIAANYLALRMKNPSHSRNRLLAYDALKNKNGENLREILYNIILAELSLNDASSRELMKCIQLACLQERSGFYPLLPYMVMKRSGILPLIPLLAGIGTALGGAGALTNIVASARGGYMDPLNLNQEILRNHPVVDSIVVKCGHIPLQDTTTDMIPRSGLAFLPILAALAGIGAGVGSISKGIHRNVTAGRSGSIVIPASGSFLVDSLCDLFEISSKPHYPQDRVVLNKINLYRKHIADMKGANVYDVSDDMVRDFIFDDPDLSDDQKSSMIANM